MMRFYYISDGEKKGPVPAYALKDMVRDEEISADTLIWHEGMSGWKPLAEVPAAGIAGGDVEVLRSPEKITERAKDLIEQAGMSEEQRASMEEPPLPEKARKSAPLMARLMARWLDISIYQFVALLIIWLSPMRWLDFLVHPVGLFVMIAMMIGFESLMLHFTGTTAGKHFMRLKLVHGDGGRFLLGKAVRRSFEVFVFGCGFFLPPLMVLSAVVNLWFLRKIGNTLWDQRLGMAVVDCGTGLMRGLMAFGLIIVLALISMKIPEGREAVDYLQRTIEEQQKAKETDAPAAD